jgi:hypothetical protein
LDSYFHNETACNKNWFCGKFSSSDSEQEVQNAHEHQ